jgi:hypothetical protein
MQTDWNMSDDSPYDEWEYEIVKTKIKRWSTDGDHGSVVKKVNKMGRKGWELVETLDREGGGTEGLLFKRPLTEERKKELEEQEDEKGGLSGLLGGD